MQAVKDFVKHQPDFSEAARVQADGLGDRGHKIRDPVAKLGLSLFTFSPSFSPPLIFCFFLLFF